MGDNNKSTFILHYRDLPEWLEQSPLAFHLLAEFARRARRIAGDVGWNGENIHLEPLEFITGRLSVSRELGLSEGEYRGAYKKLEKYGLIQTIRTTKRYTIAKYCANNVFSINPKEDLPSKSPSQIPSSDPIVTTNNNDKNVNNVKSRLDTKEDGTFKPFIITNPKDFSPTNEGETVALEIWKKLDPLNPLAFQSTYLWAYKKGLPPHLFYQFASEIQQDPTILKKGAVFRKKTEDFLAKRQHE